MSITVGAVEKVPYARNCPVPNRLLSVIVLGKTTIESKGSDPDPAVAAVTVMVAVALVAPGMLEVIVAVPTCMAVTSPAVSPEAITLAMSGALEDQVAKLVSF
jgi:hypothetical protein